MLLPNAHLAVVDIRKLEDYCLSTTHPIGRHKARVFLAALGLSQADASWLRDMILRQALISPAEEILVDEHGIRYDVDMDIQTSSGSARVRSSWIVRIGEDFPRLTTCYVLGSNYQS